jgi:hypothetical protein
MSSNNLPDFETAMKHTKPAGLTDNEKEYAWSKIEAGLTTSSSSFSYRSFWKHAQSKIIAGVVGLVILGGGAATASAHYAKPGDFLFPIEIAKEKAQIFLAGDEKKKETLHIKFAEKRLSEVRALAAILHASSTLATTTGSSTTSTTTPTPVLPKNLAKKIERAERGITIALAQLSETRKTLADAGNTNATLILDDIIEELKGVGDGTITITHLATNGKGQSGQVSIRATVTATSSASSTVVSTIKIDEKKNGAKIVVATNNIKTEITLGNNKGKKDDKHEDDHGNKNEGKHENKNKDKDDDRDDKDDHDNKKNGKKINVCHVSGGERHTINIAVNAARAHLAHGDRLGTCSTPTPTPTNDTTAPNLTNIAVTPAQNGATINWNTNEQATARVWLSTTSPVPTTGTPTAARESLAGAHAFSMSSLLSGTTYYYIVSSADATDNRATSSQGSFTTTVAADITGPTVSGTSVSVNTTSATLSFTTSESSRARIWVSTSSPVSTTGTPAIDESSFATAHSATLSSLTPSTLYRYVISVVDSAGNRATTSEATFTTTTAADTIAPFISAINAATTTSSATISWSTDESTNGMLYFGQTTPINLTTASNIAINTFATTHQAVLSGLTSTTTYHYLIVARDSAGNTATSSQQSFITGN